MPTVTKPYGDFVNNIDVVDAVKINAQANTLYNAVNGGLDFNNVPTLGDVSTLTTTAKTSAVAAINELNSGKANKTQEAFIAPTLLNGWVNFGAGFAAAGYMKDQFGFVHLKGMVKSGTVGTVIFTLPAGYRPAETQIFIVQSNNGADVLARIDISNNGNVTLTSGGTTWVALNGITFLGQ